MLGIWTRAETRIRLLREKYLQPFVFIHINKTGGSSVEAALGLRFEHKTAVQKIGEMGIRAWNRKFTFSVVRNPWDKVVSHYFYRVQTDQTGLGDGAMDFNTWVARSYGEKDPKFFDQPQMFQSQADWLCDPSGEVLVEFVGRFERLSADYDLIRARIGRGAPLPHLKQSRRGDYRDFYDDESRRIVELHFAADLALFDYSF